MDSGLDGVFADHTSSRPSPNVELTGISPRQLQGQPRGKIEDVVVRAVIQLGSETKLQVDVVGLDLTALIAVMSDETSNPPAPSHCSKVWEGLTPKELR